MKKVKKIKLILTLWGNHYYTIRYPKKNEDMKAMTQNYYYTQTNI